MNAEITAMVPNALTALERAEHAFHCAACFTRYKLLGPS